MPKKLILALEVMASSEDDFVLALQHAAALIQQGFSCADLRNEQIEIGNFSIREET